ncbi:hypothetical protein I6N90_00495 [Paenibacillus sp. GSMTC-2017]|uniref:hypothetical protein n=1 Tax=Paenibacillus sp. GSMTC-2017 TaxID=2794350 RepID=UPI0018D6BF0C|nr:hypothetical protein [Paenibacillus sp. GSMTC-2017]MBH5316285.1 hypothetical protein [Paenibacillus sp. GSMTC-2017]
MSDAYPAIDDLVNAMKGVPTTNQWDIVCSYNVDQLNSFLLAQYEAGKLAKEVQLSTERENPLTGEEYTIRYTIHFASPKLSFVSGRSGYASLLMPMIEGSSYSVIPKGSDKPSRTTQIPTGKYSVFTIVPLAAICGDTGKIVEQDGIITFNDGKEHETHVIIHFKNEKGTSYRIQPDPDPKDKDPLVTYFLPILSEYFQTKIEEIDYALSTLNNKVPSSGQTVLTPLSFAFASTGDQADGVLSLYIQTKESGNPPGNLTPTFQPNDRSMFPIPKDYSASLILSNSIISKVLLQPQLAQLGYSVSFDPAKEGIAATLKKSVSVIANGQSGYYYTSNWSYEGLNLSFENDPLQLTISDAMLSLDWEGSTISSWVETVGNPPGVRGMPQIYRGQVNISIRLDIESVPITLDEHDVISSNIAASQNDYHVVTKVVGHEDGIPPRFYTNEMSLVAPSIHFSFQGLNFIKTTNLLAPGKHMIQFDTSVGVKTPHDFLLVGQIIKGEN